MAFVPAQTPGRSARKAHVSSLSRRYRFLGFLFVLPSLVLISVLFLIPLLMSFWISLNNWPLLGDHFFIGLKNYLDITQDALFWQSLWFTTRYTLVVTPITIVLAFGLALLVKQPLPLAGVFRTVFFIPVVIGLGVASLLFVWMFNDQVGIFNALLLQFHLIKEPILFLADPLVAIIAVGAVVIWKTVGSSMLFIMIGMNAIPDELYEAAHVDGAGWWPRLFYLTLPLLRRTFALALILSVIGSYLSFDQFYIMTKGAPENQTITLVYWIFNTSFVYYKMGYGSALSIVLLAILVVFTIIQLYLLRDDSNV
ncbi:MAG TPA: sugar ABC transporter permease [Ktedonobacteraceae bacterium]|nr:sugar ABC transporter permease [Ktedonobacteraceae bacterium]